MRQDRSDEFHSIVVVFKKRYLLHSLSIPSGKWRCFQSSSGSGVIRWKEPGPLGYRMEEHCLLTRHTLEKLLSVLEYEDLRLSLSFYVNYISHWLTTGVLKTFIWFLSMVVPLRRVTPFSIQRETNRKIKDVLSHNKHSKAKRGYLLSDNDMSR